MLFEDALALGAEPIAAANWITQDVAALRNAGGDGRITAQHVADLVRLLADGAVTGAGAKQALEEAFASGEPIDRIVEARGLAQVSDTGALGGLVDEVIAEHPEEVEKFRAGKEAILGFLVGQLMKKTRGSANPSVAKELLLQRLRG